MKNKKYIKEYLIKILKVIISLSLLAYLFYKNDWRLISEKISHSNFLYLILSILVMILIAIPLINIRWKLLLSPANIKISFRDLVKLSYIGLFFNLFLPGNISGDGVKGLLMYKITKNSSVTASSIALDRIMGLIALAAVSVISSCVYYNMTSDFTFSLESGGFLVILLICFGLALLPSVQKIISKVLTYLKLTKLEEFTRKSFEFIGWFKKYPSILIQTFIISLFTHFLSIFACFLVGYSLGLKVHIGYYYLFCPVISIILSVPISINGIGLRESAFVYFFAKIGVPQFECISLSILYFFVCIVPSLIGGIIYAFSSFKNEPDIKNEEVMGNG
jgi:hypothetical protein